MPTSRPATTLGTIVLTLALVTGAARTETLAPAHHGGAGLPLATDHVAYTIETAREACFNRGDDPRSLSDWAEDHHWQGQPSEELRRSDNPFTTISGGWTFESSFGAFAVLQSAMRAPNKGHVCSVTTILSDETDNQRIFSDFEQHFAAELAERSEQTDLVTRRYWIARGARPPVKASIVYAPASHSLTIRMIHGELRPLGL